MEKTYFLGEQMKVCVINKNGRPLMPTTPRKARLLLKSGKAKIARRKAPFTIQLVYGSSGYVQPATLGIDAGYSHIGFSAVNDKEELIGGELTMLSGMSERITEKRKYRRMRRNRKRYRQPLPLKNQPQGWLAPSIQHKLDTHHWLIDRIKSVLPIKQVAIKVASFDIQKIKDPTIDGKGYQQGEQYEFAHLREYVLHRDGHKCQNPDCKNKAKEAILQVHHLGFWKNPPDRTDRPANLMTLCSKCHTPKNHKKEGFLYGWEPKLKAFKGETFMSTVRWRLTQEGAYEATYGCITKAKRRELQLEKSHHNDAFAIATGTTQARTYLLLLEQVRRHRRSLEQFYDARYVDTRDKEPKTGTELSSGRRTRNKNLSGENLRSYRGHKLSKGRRAIKRKRYTYKQHDIVLFEGKAYEVIGMQNLGTRLSLKPDADSKTKYKTAAKACVKPLRRRGGICE